MNSRTIRVSAAALLVGAAAATLWPHMTSYVSTSAMVNAPVLRIKAPFNGTVTRVSTGRTGEPVSRGDALLSLERARAMTGEVAGIDAEARVVTVEIASLDERMAAVEGVARDLSERIDAHRAEAESWIAAKRRVVAAGIDKAAASLDLALRELDRHERLAARGAVPDRELEAVRAEVAVARAERDRLRGEASALGVEGAAIARGIMLESGAEGAGYARQRLDEVTLLLAELRARHAVLEARRDTLAVTREETTRRLDRQGAFDPVSAVEGAVWRAGPEVGAEAAVGDVLMEVVDCERRFLEVSLPERHFERVRPGDTAIVQLKGAAGTLTATVSAVGGSSARLADESFASARPDTQVGSAQVLLSLPPARGPGADGFGFCDVGRTAQVRFPRAPMGGLDEPIASLWSGARDRVM